jgi:hypothetical protein
MRGRSAFIVLVASFAVGCGSSSGGASTGDGQNVVSGSSSSGGGAQKDVSDTGCRVVLRAAGPSGLGGGEGFHDPKTGNNWARYRAMADVDSTLVQAGATVGLLYQSSENTSIPNPVVTVPAVNPQDNPNDPALTDPTAGLNLNGLFGHVGQLAPPGYTRLAFATTTDTFEEGSGKQPPLQMIPFVHLPNGTTLWDHNRNPSGNYNLDQQHNFIVTDDFGVCPKPKSE